MSVIYPGNYVAHLNSYKDQAVLSLPGIEFHQVIGVATYSGASGTGDQTLKILSPDKRGDDKPRADKAFTIPAGARVYRTSINTYNLKSSRDAAVIKVDGLGAATFEASFTTVGGLNTTNGAKSNFLGLGDGTSGTNPLPAEASARTIVANISAGHVEPIDTGDQAAIIVEVCYAIEHGAPTFDDVHLPYLTEAGAG